MQGSERYPPHTAGSTTSMQISGSGPRQAVPDHVVGMMRHEREHAETTPTR